MSQPRPKPLQLTPDELAKVTRARQRHQKSRVEPEWLFIAEFGYYYGWAGVQAIMNNEILNEQANILLRAAQKVWSGKVLDTANAIYVGSAAAQSKKGGQVMKKGLADYLKDVKADV